MSLITRLQRLLLQLGISSGTGQMMLIAALLSLLAFGAFRLDGLNVSAKSAQFTGSLVRPASLGVPWQTVHEFEPEDLKPLTRSFAEDGAPVPPKVAAKPRTLSDSGESLFLQSSRLLQQGHYAQALKVAEDMAYRYPNFQLGNLLLADLTATMAPRPSDIDMVWKNPESQRRLSELQIEAQRRTRHAGKEALAGKQPEPLRYLSSKINHVVLVDAHKSRLYVLARQTDALPDAVPLVIFDAYVSVGNSGTGKWREGDGKTPVGVYFVQKHLTDPMLPDLYGSGALTLDYPSPIDKWQKRTGSGIWLHGSASSQYARAPTSTDGCVVLANDDMTRLVQLGIPPETPVIIAEQLNWHTVTALASGDQTKSLVTPVKRSSQPPWPQPADLRDGGEAWHMVSAFQWKDQQQTVAVVSYDPPASSASKHRLHTYWIMQGDQWQQVNRPSAP
ncbi:hypothetical protein B9Z47_02705 [Limnohabitans sp. 2KL-1]|uniref:L,D-transpeptidase family protein n=1 Tax=Limnohabitans sp. 2KL-1 TaxID=1100699 RepID=UPI000D366E5E|nr:L,D-transpeptidase family protein [Limnohabitans sp. 2KL-1]PUE50677.1 hypothetical protein B9Z47_02705 [Limnohabitans sp. 2KL-1]